MSKCTAEVNNPHLGVAHTDGDMIMHELQSMGRDQGLFRRPQKTPTRHLLVANCGSPAEHEEELKRMFSQWGNVEIVLVDDSRCFVSLADEWAAQAAQAALHGTICSPALGGKPLVVCFAEKRDVKSAEEQPLVAVRTAAECGIPGLSLLLDFVTAAEENALLQLADAQQHWQLLAKRRVLHFGREFDYETRGLGPVEHPIPPEARSVAARVEALPGGLPIDQLTVNEYAPGVGISPHVETHSAFTGAIASLSLAGPAAVVLRREGHPQHSLFLPPRSLLLLAGEARYCWQHYIPHRKSDLVAAAQPGGPPEVVPRAQRRVSFTFRQARGFPCDCAYPQHCDSQLAPLEPTRMALKRMQQQQQQQQRQQGEEDGQQQQPADDSRPQTTSSGAQCNCSSCSSGKCTCGASRSDSMGQEPAAAAGAAGADQGTVPLCPEARCQPAQMLQQDYPTVGSAAGAGGGEPAGAATRGATAGSSLDRQLAALERQYVHQVYDAIAPHFAATRFAVWPRVRAFLEALPGGALVADVGCGNGKYFGVRRDAFVLGSDRSEGLARVAARRLQPPPMGERLRADVAVADGMALPYRPASCDGVLCIAVLHHISSPSRRLAMLAQLLRVLRPGGRALVTVWATEQENMKKVRSWQPIGAPGGETATGAAGESRAACGDTAAQQRGADQQGAAGDGGVPAQQEHQPAADAVASGDYFVPWHLPYHRAEAAAAARQAQQAAQQDAGAAAAAPRLDGRKGAVVYQRYYHLFERGELDGLVEQLPGASLVDSFYDKDNWCCIFERVHDGP